MGCLQDVCTERERHDWRCQLDPANPAKIQGSMGSWISDFTAMERTGLAQLCTNIILDLGS